MKENINTDVCKICYQEKGTIEYTFEVIWLLVPIIQGNTVWYKLRKTNVVNCKYTLENIEEN